MMRRTLAIATLALALLVLAPESARADIYMHNPRGSNNRNCRNSNSADRANGNRLFDSENNDQGGYSCPRAYPFDCYKHADDDAARATCNAINTGLSDADAKAAVDSNGDLVHPEAINTPRMYYFAGSVLPIEWTNQHGSGANGKVHSEVVIQVACETDDASSRFSFTDDCGGAGGEQAACQPRDGTPINNQDGTNTNTIPDTVDAQDDYRYGRHESLRFYQFCRNLQRNKGLFTADQNLDNRRDARFTRQDPGGTRQGLECKEEAHYYPWWNPSPWIDVAVITSDVDKCLRDATSSQNVAPKAYCNCSSCTADGSLPIAERACVETGGSWVIEPSWQDKLGEGVRAPQCIAGDFSRDNHLGNVGAGGQPYFYNWTVPDFLVGRDRCVLRLRYNISTGDFDDVSVRGDSLLNGDDLSPLRDRNNNPEDVYQPVPGLCTATGDNCRLGLAINTDQTGRTFQDRSYLFSVRERPAEPECSRIHNLNVRGKRGNIVQVYPAVEYDFVPNKLLVTEDDCVHVQWVGSDYNPARDPNNGEGGPPNPNNLNEGKTDRSNMVQLRSERDNTVPTAQQQEHGLFGGSTALLQKLAFVDQPLSDASACMSYTALKTEHPNNNNALDRDHRNCMKLSGAKTPYFDAGLLKSRRGVYEFFSSRNNNFSNRGQKGVITVMPGGSSLSTAAVVGVAIGTVAASAVAAAAGFFLVLPWYRRRSQPQRLAAAKLPTLVSHAPAPAAAAKLTPAAGAAAAGVKRTVRAAFDHIAEEPGELTFKQGDEIAVLREDASGWWEGRLLRTGALGIFPGNYVADGSSKTVATALSAV